jgi:hypothetical protein
MMLKTRSQWRKQDFRRVKANEKPTSHSTIQYVAYDSHQASAVDGSITTWKTQKLLERHIPLYSCKRRLKNVALSGV